MKQLIFFLVFCLTCGMLCAQKVYFLYFETDNNTPFYVKLSDKVYSSNGGYLTIPDLLDSTYKINVGYTSGNLPESVFDISINGKDKGFSIKRMDDGLNLVDLQTQAQIKPNSDFSEGNVIYKRKNDEFTTLLSKAANDSSLLLTPVVTRTEVAKKEEKEDLPKKENEVVKTEEVKEDVHKNPALATSVAADTLTAKVTGTASGTDTAFNKPAQTDAIAENKKPDSVTGSVLNAGDTALISEKNPAKIDTSASVSTSVEPAHDHYKRSVVVKHAESSTSDGFGLVFYDKMGNVTDTIRLVIPNPKSVFRITDTTATVRGGSQFLNFTNKDANTGNNSTADTSLKTGQIQLAKDTNKILTPSRSACTSMATNKDFLKLRRNMADQLSDESMIKEAKKYFKNKCFSTEQIKNLSALFLTPALKYEFFDAAYLHVSDPEQFASLALEINDDYYLRRFKALIGE